MILWGAAMVRNEADIVEAFVRHNLSILDGLLVIDHGSADTTLDILTALCRERLPLVVMKNDAVGYMQQAVMTQAVRHAFASTRADFVFPLDADEFVKAVSRNELERALAAVPADAHGLLSWPTYVPDLRRPAADILAALRGARREIPKIVQPGFADGDDGVHRAQFAQQRFCGVRESGRVVRVHARGHIQFAGMVQRQPERRPAPLPGGAGDDHLRHAGRPRTRQHRLAVAVEGVVRQVAADVDQFHSIGLRGQGQRAL